MKKLIAVLLSLVLLSNLALVFIMIQNNNLLKQMLASGNTPVSMPTVSESPVTHATPAPDGEVQVLVHQAEDKYLEADGAWHFNFTIQNTTDTNLYIYSLDFIDNGGENVDHRDIYSDPMLFEMMMGPNFATTPIIPGEFMRWGDGHPGEYLTDRTYLFTFVDDNGVSYTAEYEYNLLMEVRDGMNFGSTDYADDQGRDLLTLRYEAGFEIEVAPDAFWVPVRALGESHFSNAEISQMVSETPEIKQNEITTLYEALQLYQVGSFIASDDNIRMSENGINWEHHKPGYHAVASNNGCCATSANWLNYILKGDYEEVGFVATSQRDGNGHIYNYIFHDGWYYFIDLTHYRTDWIATAIESGDLNDYYNSDFVLGNLHKCRTVDAFVNYVQDAFGDPPGLMFQYTADDCLAIDSAHRNGGVVIIYEDHPDVSLNVIFDDPADALSFELAPQPLDRPSW